MATNDRVLRLAEVNSLQSRLDSMRKNLTDYAEKINGYHTDDPRFQNWLLMISQANEDLAKAYSALAITKARLGIVGNSWYKKK